MPARSPTFIKSIIESTLTGINGPIRELEIDKIIDKTNNIVEVEGTFSTVYNLRKFKFDLEIDNDGNILKYNKTSTNTY